MALSEKTHDSFKQSIKPPSNDRPSFWTRRFGAVEKRLIRGLFGLINTGCFRVLYWDGSEEDFGRGEPWFKLAIRDQRVVGRMVKNPALHLGEAYADGSIEIQGDLEHVLRLIYLNHEIIVEKILNNRLVPAVSKRLKPGRQKENIQHHYDLGNDFFALWLDPTMSYSCAYFKDPKDPLEQAQLQKIDHILEKLRLKNGETLLDIGSGWGWLIIRAAQQYGVKATGITLSQEQYEKSRALIEQKGLEHQIEVLLMDYTDLALANHSFDKIVSVGMFEHVGKANIPEYMYAIKKMLNPGGLSLLHTITHTTEIGVNPWIEKYIFPGGYIPSLRETIWALPTYDFNLLDVECLRMHYALTLDHWARNFEKKADLVKKMYDQRFVRMWRLYLYSCAASFRYSGLSVHQLLFSKGLVNELPLTRSV